MGKWINLLGWAAAKFKLVNWKRVASEVEARNKHHLPPFSPRRIAREMDQILLTLPELCRFCTAAI
jgi:hypothetical protein